MTTEQDNKSSGKPATLAYSKGPVGSMARRIIGGHELRLLFRIRTRRQRFSLGLDGSAGEVSLDASEIPVGEDSVNIRPVEVETENAPTPELRGLRELGTTTGGTRVPRGGAFTMGVYSERCSREARDLRAAVPGSKPFRVLTKGKERKKFEKVLQDELDVTNTGLR